MVRAAPPTRPERAQCAIRWKHRQSGSRSRSMTEHSSVRDIAVSGIALAKHRMHSLPIKSRTRLGRRRYLAALLACPIPWLQPALGTGRRSAAAHRGGPDLHANRRNPGAAPWFSSPASAMRWTVGTGLPPPSPDVRSWCATIARASERVVPRPMPRSWRKMLRSSPTWTSPRRSSCIQPAYLAVTIRLHETYPYDLG
jgi:hypothetical protein